MFEFLNSANTQVVISMMFLVWSLVWSLFAGWKSSKKGHKIWFVLIFLSLIAWYLYPNIVTTILGLFGAIPLLYFFIFSRFKFEGNKLVFEKFGKKSKVKKDLANPK